MKKLFLILTLLPFVLFAQALYDSSDVKICNEKFEFAKEHNLQKLPIGDVITTIGKTFLGTPYVAHTLEAGDTEKVVVHLSGLDCYTFFESTLAISRCIKMDKMNFQNYLKQIETIRYRGGKLNGYISRLHYALDWVCDNDKRGIVKNVTKEIGGVPLNKKVFFMSTHPNLYKRLKDNPDRIKAMEKIEDEINSRQYYYIPQDKIAELEKGIHNGDILLLTTSWKGLGIGHTGIAIKMPDGRIHFMHAPLAGKKVQITTQPLADYVKIVKKHTGVIVARPLEPKK
jgi:hypothetical protein